MELTGVLVSLLGASFVALVTYLAAVRKLSGKINTSEAAQLWAESASIREDYRDRMAASERRTLALEERVAKLEKINTDLSRENATLTALNTNLQQTIVDLRSRVDALEKENESLHKMVTSLRTGKGDDVK